MVPVASIISCTSSYETASTLHHQMLPARNLFKDQQPDFITKIQEGASWIVTGPHSAEAQLIL